MARPWVDRPKLDCRLDQSGLGLTESDVAALVPYTREMLDDLRSQVGGVDAELAEMIDAGTAGRFRAEAEAWGRLVGRPWQEILLASCAYDAAIRVFMCSGVTVETEHGPVLARNMDWWPERPLALGSVMLRYSRGDEFVFENAGWVGAIGAVSGMSDRGFALAMNAVMSNDPVQMSGYPVMLFLRSVLEDAGSYDEAFEMICKTDLASPCLVLLVGTENHQRAVIERTPKRHAVRRGTPGQPLVVTNDYRVIDEEASGVVADGHGLYRSACGRYEGLANQFESRDIEPTSDDAMLYALSHPSVRMEITAQQMIFRPGQARSKLTAPDWFFADAN
ncbi:MAG: C45 family autoproteolytic acyltransferase/hydrolase [Planctomycetota bacterium]